MTIGIFPSAFYRSLEDMGQELLISSCDNQAGRQKTEDLEEKLSGHPQEFRLSEMDTNEMVSWLVDLLLYSPVNLLWSC